MKIGSVPQKFVKKDDKDGKEKDSKECKEGREKPRIQDKAIEKPDYNICLNTGLLGGVFRYTDQLKKQV